MPEGMGYPKGKGILGKVNQGDFGADVAKRPNEKLEVNPNQKVKQGDVIGTVGATGRATGTHLDIRLNWFQTRLDPATVLDIK